MVIIVSIFACHNGYTESSAKSFLAQTPLVLLLVASVALSLWATVTTFLTYFTFIMKDPLLLLQIFGISWPCKRSMTFSEKARLNHFQS